MIGAGYRAAECLSLHYLRKGIPPVTGNAMNHAFDPPPDRRPPPPQRAGGFALVVTLSLMILPTLIAAGQLTLSRI